MSDFTCITDVQVVEYAVNLRNCMNNHQQMPLLRTKLHRPQYDSDVVLRSQLFARLDEGLRCPLSLVSAPAGFGKTTVLSEWIPHSKQ